MTNDLISRATEINASPTTIFEYLTQPDLALRWVPGAQSIEILKGSPGKVGASTLSILQLNAKTHHVTETVTAAESPRKLISEIHTSAGKSIQDVAIKEIGSQRSKVTISYEVVEVAW